MDNLLSNGEPNTLGTWRRLAVLLTNDENHKAVKFWDEKISKSPNGAEEQVIAHETQVLALVMSML